MQTQISPSQLKQLIANGECHLVDVREPVEHAEEHIREARLIPLGELEKRAAELPKDKPLVIHCRSGKRGTQAQEKLMKLGFGQVQNLEGGIQAWKAAGLPVASAEKKVFPLMQQVQLAIGTGVLTGAVLSLTVHPYWVFLSAFFGAGLLFAGSTGWCGLAILLSKMPWNRVSGQACCSPKNCAVN
ncbi:rhodanese-like domain-containing protein [Prosthecobacter sp. SYSU 5D2]|uniref:rhodanese-like domain-containing protein n=1 Tax=Prosthecobacter sp. SYSU 5D2 TaxID=3134134 RepID=UPI0031FF15E4